MYVCVLLRARTVRWCRRDRAASWARWWSAAWRAWPAPEAQPALASSKIRATATQRKRKKVKAKHVLLPFNPHVCPSAAPPPPPILSPLLHSSVPGMKAPLRLFSSLTLTLMGHFLLLFSSTITAAGATVTPLSLGRRLFISCPDLSVALLCGSSSGTARQPCCSWCVISGLISCLLRWASGRTPYEFLLQTPDQHTGPITTHFTWHLRNRRNCNLFSFLVCKGSFQYSL